MDEDSKAISLLGKLMIVLPDQHGAGIRRQITVRVYFGETEIKVTAIEFDSKKQVNVRMNYFNATAATAAPATTAAATTAAASGASVYASATNATSQN